ncbi:beta-ketoacyl-[acyl-carrier-protein] synthase II, partial [Pseudomonas sp. Fl4BN2]|nr:beta-ketoacyl-[acyl-carrier-protein] synthase II [Pseudomonas sp. Fl4BN2]
GDDVSAIRRNLATGHAPGMRAADRPDGSTGMVGRALAALELEPPARLSAFDCRNNRLLLAALAQIQPVVDRARAEYGPHRIGIVLGTSTSGIDAAEAALLYAKEHGKLPDAFDYRQMEIGTLAPFAAAAIGTTGPAYT